MNRIVATTLVAGLVWFGSTLAAPAAPIAPAKPAANADTTAVVKVHGFHRGCLWGPARGWWHRHVGPHGRPIACGRTAYYVGPDGYYGPSTYYSPGYYYGRRSYYYGPGIGLRFGGFGHHHHRHHGHHGRRR